MKRQIDEHFMSLIVLVKDLKIFIFGGIFFMPSCLPPADTAPILRVEREYCNLRGIFC